LLDHRSRAKAGNLLRISNQPITEPPRPERCVYHMLAAKSRSNLCRRQHADKRQVARQRLHLSAGAGRPVNRGHEQRCLSCADRIRHFLEPANSAAGPASEPDRVNAALREKSLDAVRKAGGNNNRLTRSPRKEPLGNRPIHYIPARCQPQTASGQPRRNIGYEFAVRGDDEA
jgi:hypothetical protein